MSTSVRSEPGVVHGVLLEQDAQTAVIALPGTDYRLSLTIARPIEPGVNQRVSGRIIARAKRLDTTRGGGRFIEPIYGRPRRVQGVVTATESSSQSVTVRCAPGCDIVCKLTSPGQTTDQFAIGQMVGCDLEKGAVFSQL